MHTYPARPRCPFPQSWPRAISYPQLTANMPAATPQPFSILTETYPQLTRKHTRGHPAIISDSAGNLSAINPQTYPRPPRNHLLFCRELTRNLPANLPAATPQRFSIRAKTYPQPPFFSPQTYPQNPLCLFALVSPYTHYLVLLAHCTFRSCYRRFNFRQ